MNVAKGLSVVFIVKEKQLLVSLIFSILFFLSLYFIYFGSNLYYFLPSNFGIGFVLLLVPLGVMLGYLFENFLVS